MGGSFLDDGRDEDLDSDSASPFEIIDDLAGARETSFGEFLVERRALTRAQLVAALCEHDKHGNVALGDVIAWMGFMTVTEMDELVEEWRARPAVDLA
jgi:hypothetical protein